MNQRNDRTDLAVERRRADTDIPGVSYRKEEKGGIILERLEIAGDEGEASIGRPAGLYLTLQFCDADACQLIRQLGECLREMLTRCTGKTGTGARILAVGLGNSEMAADCIGPRTVAGITATGHLRQLEPQLFSALSQTELYTLIPGVMGNTGMESAEVIRGVARQIRPDLILAIDALVARSAERLLNTVQLCDTGISPGSGIGNRRSGIHQDSIGFPVVGIGVPTVIESATLVYDLFDRIQMDFPEQAEPLLKHDALYVCPKDIDIRSERIARLLAHAIDSVFGIGDTVSTPQTLL